MVLQVSFRAHTEARRARRSRGSVYARVAASPVEGVDMSVGRNAPPKGGWAKIATELHVNDLEGSLAFWKEILGFEIACGREEGEFVAVEHARGEAMVLCQRHGRLHS